MTTYAPATPRSAPRRASAPAVAPVSVRRMREVAPVAVRVRRSPALSLRISPTVNARMPSARSALAAVGDLVARQGPARLDQPPARNLLPAVAAKTAGSDERDVPRGQPHGGAEEVPADVDPLDVGDREFPSIPEARDDELVGRNP